MNSNLALILFGFCLIISCLIELTSAEYNCEYKKDGFYADEDFCHIYWRCNYGVAEEYECPAGTAWNHIENRCDWLDNVDCSRVDDGGKKKDKENGDDEEEAEVETTKKPKKSKQKTTEPIEETTPAVEETEPAESNNKADSSQTTNTPSGSNSASNSTNLCQSFGSYYVADNSNCASYYMCNNGKEAKMNCPEKQLFNTDTTQCEDFQQVFCGTRPVNLADRNQCSSKRDGIYPDLERGCRVFYQCLNQQKVREANCPNSLRFNSISGRCDISSNILPPCGTYSTSKASRQTSSYNLWMESLIYLTTGLFTLKKIVF